MEDGGTHTAQPSEEDPLAVWDCSMDAPTAPSLPRMIAASPAGDLIAAFLEEDRHGDQRSGAPPARETPGSEGSESPVLGSEDEPTVGLEDETTVDLEARPLLGWLGYGSAGVPHSQVPLVPVSGGDS